MSAVTQEPPQEVVIEGTEIELNQFLKLSRAVSSGGEGKALIQQGAVRVNGEVETRRSRKLALGRRGAPRRQGHLPGQRRRSGDSLRVLFRRIELFQFRNYQALELAFTACSTSSSAKTPKGRPTSWRPIYLLALGRSYRTTSDDDLIHWDAPFARVRGETEREAGGTRIEILLRREGPKEIQVGGETLRRHSDLLGNLNAVVFSPDDLQLVKGSPALRRRFLDIEIAQVSPAYRHHFTRYQRVLAPEKQPCSGRSPKGLPGGRPSPIGMSSSSPTDPASSRSGRRPCAGFPGWSREMQARISGGREELDLVYRPFFAARRDAREPNGRIPEPVAERFREALEALRREEVARGTTLVGPQRDDIAFMVERDRPALLRLPRPATDRGTGDQACRAGVHPGRGGGVPDLALGRRHVRAGRQRRERVSRHRLGKDQHLYHHDQPEELSRRDPERSLVVHDPGGYGDTRWSVR